MMFNYQQQPQFGAQFYGAGMPAYGQGAVAPQQQKRSNVLTPEEIAKLRQNSAQFSLAITKEEWLRGVCNHRSEDGMTDALVFDKETEEAVCTICGYKFKPIDANTTPETIKDAVYTIIDILQTIKVLYIDLPADAAKEYFQIIPLIEKIPQLFEYAAKNMAKHEVNTLAFNNRNMNAINMFQNLGNVFGMMNQPMMPGAMPMPGAGVGGGYGFAGTATPQPGSNPFGYPGAQPAPNPNPAFTAGVGAPPPQYSAAPGFSFTPNPQAATQPVTPTVTQAPTAAPVTPAPDVKVTEKVQV